MRALDGRRLGTFPDLISTFYDEGTPITSAAIEEGGIAYISNTSRDLIPIRDGNRYSEVYEPIENALGRPIISHLKSFLMT